MVGTEKKIKKERKKGPQISDNTADIYTDQPIKEQAKEPLSVKITTHHGFIQGWSSSAIALDPYIRWMIITDSINIPLFSGRDCLKD